MEARPLLDAGEYALHVEGDLTAARSWFSRAYALADEAGDGRLMAAAALGLGGLWVHEHRPVEAAAKVESCQRAALAVAGHRPEALRLRIRLAAESDYRAGRHRTILPLLEQARHGPDPVAYAEALSLAHNCLLGPDQARARLGLAEELMRAGARTDRPSDALMGLLWRTIDLFLLGDPHAERSFSEVSGSTAARRNTAVWFAVAGMRVMLGIRTGRLDEAERLAYECAEYGKAAGNADEVGWLGAQLAAIRWYQGRIAELAGPLTELANSPKLSETDNGFLPTLAVAAATAGDLRTARGALARFRGDDFAAQPRSSSWLIGMNGVAEAAFLLGDSEIAARVYELLAPYAWLPVMGGRAIVCVGSAHQALGVAAVTFGDTGRAIGHFRAALDQNAALGHWPASVLSRFRLGRALMAKGEVAEARTELAVAAHEAEAFGMVLPGEPAARATCVRSGRSWRVELAGQSAEVDDSVGIRYLATLIANPDVEIAAVELAGRPDHAAGQEVLDEVALRQYRRRLEELRGDIEEADSAGDFERASRSRAELEWLANELRASTGLAGRARRFAGEPERARIAVGKAIRRALDRVAAVNPALGTLVRDAVHTGMRCCYRPAADLTGAALSADHRESVSR
ncbi:hypothetical protein SAMN05421504_108153 [Amycolatopsis xylanica]|uniref:Tetratricopeptide repeat-containing protein n=1 Tax=Amycolatopsis xylanica TaxID=589385 RepID=A0A1H3PDS6_9PSEU|nr:hypothetical protein [Amycolatopsis xylanica]SDY98965.1 hypothetical protein SAMN05421504_108153 [Amycolatopsis xylanica]